MPLPTPYSPTSINLIRQNAAIDDQMHPGDPAGGVRGEEQAGIADVVWFTASLAGHG